MSSTRTLASYLSNLKYEDLPPEVVEKGKAAILDPIGNSIGAYSLRLSRTFLDLAKRTGSGSGESTLIGDGTQVSIPMAAFGNGALSTLLDSSDAQNNESGMNSTWMGALALPAALAAGEYRGISGKELITSVVAGYECAARIVHSMDKTWEQSQRLRGVSLGVFAAAAAAARALSLDEDQFLSTLGMTGVYTPIPSGHKYLGEDGLTPRKDIKQGWAWMCMTGAFAAVSAELGLKMLQENNILDGERGLWLMVGADVSREEQLTAGLGETFRILGFRTKLYPGIAVTHSSIDGVLDLVKENAIDVGDIDAVEVITNRTEGVGFGDQDPKGPIDMEFSIPHQIAAALLVGPGGANWYWESTAAKPQFTDMVKRVSLSFDEECEQIFRDTHMRMSKISVTTKAGQRYAKRVDRARIVRTLDEVRDKFVAATSQVIDRERADKILNTVNNLESISNVSDLVNLLAFQPKVVG